MSHRRAGLAIGAVAVMSLLANGRSCAEEPATPDRIRGILLGLERATDARLREWKAKGVNSVVVPLDDSISRAQWDELATRVTGLEMALYPWIEVARNPQFALTHPEWMA